MDGSHLSGQLESLQSEESQEESRPVLLENTPIMKVYRKIEVGAAGMPGMSGTYSISPTLFHTSFLYYYTKITYQYNSKSVIKTGKTPDYVCECRILEYYRSWLDGPYLVARSGTS